MPVRNVLNAVTQINDLLLSPKVQEGLFTGIALVIARTFGYPFCAIVLFDDDMNYLELVGINHPHLKELSRRHALGNAAQRKFKLQDLRHTRWLHPVLEGLIYSTPAVEDLATPFISAARVRSMTRLLKIKMGMAVPLIARGKMVGAIILGSHRQEPAAYEQGDLIFLAQHTAIAIEMWRLYDRAEGRTALLNKLHALSQSITSTLDLDELYAEVALAAGQLANIDFCRVATLTPDRRAYQNRASWGRGKQVDVSAATLLNRFPEEWVQRGREGEILLVPDVKSAGSLRESLSDREANSVAIFPFKSQGEVVGFITVGRNEPGDWQPDDVEVLKQLSEYVAVAITNAHRYRQATRRAERMAMLHSTGEHLARIHDPETLFEALREAVQQTVDAPLLHLVLCHPEYQEVEVVLDLKDSERGAPRLERLPEDHPALRAIEASAPVHVPELPAANGGDQEAHTPRALLAVPLRVGNRAVGALTVQSYRRYAYDSDDIQTLQIDRARDRRRCC
jgi:GAF domain-containing protein